MRCCGNLALAGYFTRVFIDKNKLAATLTASAFALIGPDAGYTVVCTQAEICAPKMYFRKTCSFVYSLKVTYPPSLFFWNKA